MKNKMPDVFKYLFLVACLLAGGALHATAEEKIAPPLWLRYPAISPDGRTIAFAFGGQLWMVDAQGGEAVPLTSGEFYSTRPVWSPDGKTLAFACKRNGNFDVFATAIVGGAPPRRLTYHSADDVPYAFSADGSTIYFGSSRIGSPKTELVGAYHGSTQLYTVPVAGGAVQLLLPTPALNVAVVRMAKAWSTTTARYMKMSGARGRFRMEPGTCGSTTFPPGSIASLPTTEAKTVMASLLPTVRASIM